MFTATMIYNFKPEKFNEACEIWQRDILTLAKKQPGFVRMQLLVSKPASKAEAMAIGSWESQEDAMSFMQQGVFRDLIVKVESMLIKQPEPVLWDLKYFAEK